MRIYAREAREVVCLIEGVVDEYDLMTVKLRSYQKKSKRSHWKADRPTAHV